MRSIKFPKMLSTSHTNVWKTEDYMDATKQNVALTLSSVRGTLLGDPYFGITLKKYTFDQNSAPLRDIIADMIYTQLAIFLPQLKVERKDINIIQDRKRGQLICQFSGINQIDYTPNTFNLTLFEEDNV